MSNNWVPLVRVYRGEKNGQQVEEAIHLGAIAVVDGDRNLLFGLGDVGNDTHLRSTAKPFQLLPFILRKLHDKAQLNASQIALLMASHAGENFHVENLKQIFERLHVQESDLLCGVHAPTNEAAKNALIASGQTPSVLHNNCAGKHCAMVAVCREMGWSVDDYIEVNHPLQLEIKNLISRLAHIEKGDIGVGVDGCTAATFIAPLRSIAALYASMAFPSTGDEELDSNLKHLFSCGTSHPEMIAGSKRLDAMLMRASHGRLFAKTGAEGVYAIAVAPSDKYPHGLGIAIKIADGDSSHRARNAVVISTLLQLGVLSADQIEADEELAKLDAGTLKNLRRMDVGKIRAVFQLDAPKP